MHEAWKKLDLEGEGLQTLNVRYNRAMRRTSTAFPLMLGFPLGLHRWYLREPVGAIAYPLLCLSALWSGWRFGVIAGISVGAVVLAFLVFDLFWVPRHCVAFNKALRMRQFLQPGQAPPPGYRGRYVDEGLEDYLQIKAGERAGHQPMSGNASTPAESSASASTPPSFNEQEAMLRELMRTRKEHRDTD